MGRNDDAGRRQVFAHLAGALAETADLAKAERDAASRYAVFDRCLRAQGSSLRRLHRASSGEWLDAVAAASASMAEVLPALPLKAPAARRAAQGEALLSGLSALRDALRSVAGGLPSVASPGRERPSGRRAELNGQLRAMRESAASLAFEYHEAVLDVRRAIGLPDPDDLETFSVDPADDAGCGPCGAHLGVLAQPEIPGRAGRAEPRRRRARVNERELILVAGQLDELALLTAVFFARLAVLLGTTVFLAAASSALCINSCAPTGVVRVTHFGAGHRRTPSGIYPVASFQWVKCCACPCYLVFTEQRRVTIDVYNQTVILDPQRTYAEAMRIARQRGLELARQYNEALSSETPYQSPADVSPAFAPPDCIC